MLKALLKRAFARTAKHPAGAADWREDATRLQRAGRHEEAAALCETRLADDPEDVDAYRLRAGALFGLGRSAEGLDALEAASARAPDDGPLHLHIARVTSALGRLDPTLAHYRRACDLRAPEAVVELAAVLKAIDAYDEAEDRLRSALAHAAVERPRGLHRLAGVLFEQGRVGEAIETLRDALADAPAPDVHSDLLRALNYADDIAPEALFEEHRQWARLHADMLAASLPPATGERTAGRRLRLGYVSPYFRKHAVTFFLESVLAVHDRDAFEVFLYADVERPDEYSERLKSYGCTWRDALGLSDEALARRVREDRIDILVDLSGHTPRNRLLAFARRPAPVQVTWNGYPNTTGMAAIDYRITDARCDPPGATERLHSERLVRLPEIYMSWRPPGDAPDPGPPPCLATGRVTFGSFNSCYKLTPTIVAVWSRVLEAVPDARLVLFAIPGEHAEARLRALFSGLGVDEARIEMRPRLSHEGFLEAHREVDIALDSFPYHGTTTTCFSLWMGVPVISLAGKTHVSRVGVSLLSSIGLPSLAAPDAASYVEAASALARDPQRVAALRSTLRDRILTSPLADGRACAAALEAAYHLMVVTGYDRATSRQATSST